MRFGARGRIAGQTFANNHPGQRRRPARKSGDALLALSPQSPLPTPSPQGGGAYRASRFPPNKTPSTRRKFGFAKGAGVGLSPSHLWGGVGEGREPSNGNPCRFPLYPKKFHPIFSPPFPPMRYFSHLPSQRMAGAHGALAGGRR